ncbi:hypothetical protein JCM10049v2_000635 [Rhodotorula toruloides]
MLQRPARAPPSSSTSHLRSYLIIRYASLLRLESSESRRQAPSALHHLAYGTNRLLRTLALPYLFYSLDTSRLPPKVWLPDVGVVSAKRFARTIRYEESWKNTRQYRWYRTSSEKRDDKKERQIFSEYAMLSQADFPLLEHIVLYRLETKNFLPRVKRPSRARGGDTSVFIRRLTLGHLYGLDKKAVEQSLTPFGAGVTSLSMDNDTTKRLDSVLPRFTALQVLRLNYHYGDQNPFDAKFEATYARIKSLQLRLPGTFFGYAEEEGDGSVRSIPQGELPTLPPTANLRHLAIDTRFDQFGISPHAIDDLLQTITTVFGAVPLKTLELDDSVICSSANLAKLAQTFPTLRTFTMSDRTIWNGSRADILSALSSFRHLTTLCLRLPSTMPASPYDRAVVADPQDDSPNDENAYASTAAIACEAAEVLPTLHHVGFSGQSSSIDWFRICRDNEGRPESAEGVKFYSTDLDTR